MPAIKRNGPFHQKLSSLIQGYSKSLRFGLFLLHCTEDRSKLRVCRIQVLGFLFQISFDLAKRLENRALSFSYLVDSLSFAFYFSFDSFEVLIDAGGIKLQSVEKKKHQ